MDCLSGKNISARYGFAPAILSEPAEVEVGFGTNNNQVCGLQMMSTENVREVEDFYLHSSNYFMSQFAKRKEHLRTQSIPKALRRKYVPLFQMNR